jgi:hypothetical protein
LVSESRDRPINCHQTRLKKNLNMSMNTRLSIGQQKVIMLPDAYQSSAFDPRDPAKMLRLEAK